MSKKDSSSFKERLAKLRRHIFALDFDGCIIENPIDLFYLTGLPLSSGLLFILQSDARLCVDGRYIEIAQRESPIPVILAKEEQIIAAFKGKRALKIAFDSKNTSCQRLSELRILTRKIKKETGRSIALCPLPNVLKDLRVVKDNVELRYMRSSAKLLWEGYQHILGLIKTGVTEKFLALEFEIFCRRKGAEKLAFDPIIAFGEKSAMPHSSPSDGRLKKNDVILIDIGLVLNGYRSDMTRTVFHGEADPFLKKWYEIVKNAQKAALELCRPGISVKEVDEAATKVMAKEKASEYILHSLGHGIGLEVHESPRISASREDKDLLLQMGMVITIEPGLYFPKKGGVRYEDTIAITAKGYENFYPET
jgi:Xaa-Pro aminopeptidase